MKETSIRALSGSVYVAIVIGLAYVPLFWAAALFLILSMLCAREFGALFWKKSNGRTEMGVYLTASVYAAGIAPILFAETNPWTAALLPIIIFGFVLLTALRKSSNLRSALAGTMMGTLLISTCFLCVMYLLRANAELYSGLFILLWVNDTFAYVWGRMLGKRKLIPHISPGKTITGFVGGVLSAVSAALLIAQYSDALTIWQWATAGLVIGLFATLGDLLESALKRQRGVKDSGKLMPGHGGALDRFDGLLLAAPVFFVLVQLFLDK